MAPQKKLAYFAYADEHNPSSLRPGSLAFDYADPKFQTPYIHYEDVDLHSSPPLATVDQRSVCFLSHSSGRDVEFGNDLKPLLELGVSNEAQTDSLVVGKTASKIELIDSKSFLQTMLADPEDPVSHWLRVRLSVARKMKVTHKNLVSTPNIWMLTGIFYMEDAVT